MNYLVDASVIVAVLKREPGFEELVKRLDEPGAKLFVTPMVRFEAVAALARVEIDASKGRGDRSAAIAAAGEIVDELFEAVSAREMTIDKKIGMMALDAMRRYGKMAGHKADLNFGDCFAYAAAQANHLRLLYKGEDFIHTDIG